MFQSQCNTWRAAVDWEQGQSQYKLFRNWGKYFKSISLTTFWSSNWYYPSHQPRHKSWKLDCINNPLSVQLLRQFIQLIATKFNLERRIQHEIPEILNFLNSNYKWRNVCSEFAALIKLWISYFNQTSRCFTLKDETKQ